MDEKLDEEYNKESKEIITATIDKSLYEEILNRIEKINKQKREENKKPLPKSYFINKILKLGWKAYKEEKGINISGYKDLFKSFFKLRD